MTDKPRKPEDDEQAKDAKLLPPRELMSLIDPNPLQPIGGMPTGAMPNTDPGVIQPAGDAAGHAQTLAHDQAAPGPATVSDQPQSVDGTSTTSSSSET
jgi:hypothetical protein